MKTVQIDRGIPMPPASESVISVYPWRSMEVGDSFLFPPHINARNAKRMCQRSSIEGRVFDWRRVEDGRIRCWRVDPRHLIFVYGTLKRGHGNNRLLTESEFVGEAVTGPALFMTDGGIPFVWTEGEPLHRVAGEVYRVDDATLQRLDRLEGHPHSYRRETVEVLLGDKHDQRVEASIYLYPHMKSVSRTPAAVIGDHYVWGGRNG